MVGRGRERQQCRPALMENGNAPGAHFQLDPEISITIGLRSCRFEAAIRSEQSARRLHDGANPRASKAYNRIIRSRTVGFQHAPYKDSAAAEFEFEFFICGIAGSFLGNGFQIALGFNLQPKTLPGWAGLPIETPVVSFT